MDPMPPRGPELPSRQVETDLRARLHAGEWAPGDRLPAVADLAAHYSVARNTVIKALRRLADDHLIEIVPNWGTFRART
jgi:GntR family transcriptional regulator